MSDAVESSMEQHDSSGGGIVLLEWKSWTPEDVGRYFKVKGLSEEGDILTRENISGKQLPQMNEDRLEKIGVLKLGNRISIVKLIESITRNSPTKVFNDSIHGHIEFSPLLIKIIDTPQFQRLRFIKQLGCVYFVFPGAAHNRFEHSLGVCYLAGELALTLQRNQPELDIKDKDILCVQIAGLCHDLGCGPFSHVFERDFIPARRPDFDFEHRHLSVLMFDHLIKENHLEAKLEESGLDKQDILFIREQIKGSSQMQTGEEWLKNGRGREKGFLFEIVSNERNGIDVDKWDYFARDSHNLGITNNFDHRRYMKFARVIKVDDEKQICMREKDAYNLYDMFHKRCSLHRSAYKHKVNRIIEIMMVEALILADPHLRIFPQAEGKKEAHNKSDPQAEGKLTMSESLDDMHAYTHLTDGVLEQIRISQEDGLKESKDIIQKILKRQLYKFVGETLVNTILEKPLEISKAICLAVSEEELKGPQLNPDDLVVDDVKIDCGMKDENPVDNVRFYTKENPDKAIRLEKKKLSKMLPDIFEERYIRLYSKHAENVAKAKICFDAWCATMEESKPKDKYHSEEIFDQTGGELQIPSYGFTLSIPPGALQEGSSETISLDVLKDIPPEITLRPDETVLTYGFQCLPSGLQFVSEKPVILKIPHCANFIDPTKVQVVLYFWNHEGEVDRIVQTSNTCRVTCNHVEIFLEHFTIGFLAFITDRFSMKSKRMSFMPFLPKIRPQSNEILLEFRMVNKPHGNSWRDVHEIGEKAIYQPAKDDDDEMDVNRENMEITCQLNDETWKKNVDARLIWKTKPSTKHTVYFPLDFDGKADDLLVTLEVIQSMLPLEIMFNAHFLASAKTSLERTVSASPRSLASTSVATLPQDELAVADEVSTSQTSDDVSDGQLNTLATQIPPEKYNELSNKLGIQYNEASSILKKHVSDPKAAMRDCLSVWKNKSGGSVTDLKGIFNAVDLGGLWTIHMNH